MNRLVKKKEVEGRNYFMCNAERCDFYECVGCEYFDMMLSKLYHYEDLEEQGRLIEQKQGQWIDNHCSICGMTPLGEELWEHLDLDPPKFEYYMNYCPECGAKLRELKGTEE